MVEFKLPQLPYDYNALEPVIDEKTMILHHTKHHQGYTNKFNAAIKDLSGLEGMSAEKIIADIDKLPKSVFAAVRNNGGGYVNHSLFWTIMAPGGSDFKGPVAKAIVSSFGSYDSFKKLLSNAANTRFGSGWAWLVVTADKALEIMSTPNQDSPLSQGKTPILGIDVWEHAYYLKYNNRRPEYTDAFFSIINWEEVNRRYEQALNNA